MQVVRENDIITWESCTATIGFFDGVHQGHRYLINGLIQKAKEKDNKAVVVTFAKHPKEVLDENLTQEVITTLDEKIELFEDCGVDACFVLDFSKKMSQLSAFEFIKTFLKEKLKVSDWLIGYDHRIGHNRNENFTDYQRYAKALGIRATQLNQLIGKENKKISSSTIRKALREGDITVANQMLTYPFFFSGRVVDGFKIGRTVGFPTANLELERGKILLGRGVYAVKVEYQGNSYKGMMNVGVRPTLSDEQIKTVEVYILDFNQDIYNRHLRVEVFQKIRNEKKFNSIEELKEQLKKDKQEAVNLLIC